MLTSAPDSRLFRLSAFLVAVVTALAVFAGLAPTSAVQPAAPTQVAAGTGDFRPAEDFVVNIEDVCQFYTHSAKATGMWRLRNLGTFYCQLPGDPGVDHFIDGANVDDYCHAQPADGSYFSAAFKSDTWAWVCVAHKKEAPPAPVRIDFVQACKVITGDPGATYGFSDKDDPYSIFCELSNGQRVTSFGLTKYCETMNTDQYTFAGVLEKPSEKEKPDTSDWWCVAYKRLPSAADFQIDLYKACQYSTGDPDSVPWETKSDDPWTVYCQNKAGKKQNLDPSDVNAFCMTAADDTHDYDASRKDDMRSGWWCTPFVADPTFRISASDVCRKLYGPDWTSNYQDYKDPYSLYCSPSGSFDRYGMDLDKYCRMSDDSRFTFVPWLEVKNVEGWRCLARRKNRVAPTKIVAIGDSFTAGFGFYDDGDWMTPFTLPICMPDKTPNDACSSNSNLRLSSNKIYGQPRFSPDYGFGNQVSWAAKFAGSMGVTRENADKYYRNFAVTGSTAKEWATGSFHFPQLDNKKPLDAVADEKPQIVLMTLGGNPTLSKVLFGAGNKCSIQFDRWYACISKLVKEDETVDSLKTVYKYLLNNTNAKIIVDLYPKVVPALTIWLAEGLLVARNALNDAVVKAITDVRRDMPNKANRIQWVSPNFNVGIPPGGFSSWATCWGWTAYFDGADGPSEMSYGAQTWFMLNVFRGKYGYCMGYPSLISSDTGVHPNEDGYGTMRDSAFWIWQNWPTRNSQASRPGRFLSPKVLSLSVRSGKVAKLPVSHRGRRSKVTAKARLVPKCSVHAAAAKPCKAGKIRVVGKRRVTRSSKAISLKMPKKPGKYSVQLQIEGHNTQIDGPPQIITVRVKPRK